MQIWGWSENLIESWDHPHMSSTSMFKEKAMTPHSSTLAWKIPWMEKPDRLQSMGSLRVGHDWAASLSLFTFMHWRRKWQPTPVFLPGESQGHGRGWAAVYGVAQSWTRLKWLSSSKRERVWRIGGAWKPDRAISEATRGYLLPSIGNRGI